MKLGNVDSESDLRRIIAAAIAGGLNDSTIAELAKRLADSGETITHETGSTADLASTGGPSSLSTLLCPLFLRAAGKIVPKLGIPGRPAGGLDILGLIPGYKTELSRGEILRILSDCGYAHFTAGQRFTPLDLHLFRLRQDVGAQAVETLVTASLLSKKIAVGVQTVGLEIRVASHGNFGGDFDRARTNAKRFCRIAQSVGLAATCVLTDAEYPFQPYIGRGEALLALQKIFSCSESPWLQRHLEECAFIAGAVTGPHGMKTSRKEIENVFDANLEAQGTNREAFDTIVNELANTSRIELTANSSGFVHYDLELIRELLVSEQKKISGIRYTDPAGVILRAEPGRFVTRGERAISLRASNGAKSILAEKMNECFSITDIEKTGDRRMEVACG